MRKFYVRPLCAIAALLLAQPAIAAEHDACSRFHLGQALPTISAGELTRGQKGCGLSVFAGTEPQPFEVEVIGVLRNTVPELDYILARLSGQNLERSGVAAGMSGSPVYFDGRLAGAVAFSWMFGLDAVAGITPIGAMRRLAELPMPEVPGAIPRAAGAGAGGGTPAVSFEELVERKFDVDQLRDRLRRLSWSPAGANGAASALQWTASGFGGGAFTLLEETLGGLAPAGLAATSSLPIGGGSAPAPADPGLVPGSAVAAVLIQGDLNLAAHGTVTDRIGDEILAFGHPMFSLGPINLPLATSEVVTVISSAFNSFKVSNAGPILGAFDQDRQAGVRGVLGQAAPMTPLSIELSGLAERRFEMQVANLPQFRPVLLAVSALGALDSGSYAGGYQGLDFEARFALADREDLVVRQSFDGDQVGVASILHLLNFASFLELSPLGTVAIDGVEIRYRQVDRPRSATLLAAHPERRRVEPGTTVPLTLELQAYRGERYRQKLTVEIPRRAPEGRYVVLVGDGTSMDAARLAVEQASPETLDQALEFLRSLHSRSEVVVMGLASGPGLALAGQALPDLPGSVRQILSAAPASSAAKPLTLKIVHEQHTALDRPITGIARVDLQVEKDPV